MENSLDLMGWPAGNISDLLELFQTVVHESVIHMPNYTPFDSSITNQIAKFKCTRVCNIKQDETKFQSIKINVVAHCPSIVNVDISPLSRQNKSEIKNLMKP